MANRKQQKGPCYLCGVEKSKGYMGRHLLAEHYPEEGNESCYLLKVEDVDRNYWLFIDIPLVSSLQDLDEFLRAVWLECCGHMSAFMPQHAYRELSKGTVMGEFLPGTVIGYEYDFGSTTSLLITFVQKVNRKKEKKEVRVLARNNPYRYECEKCGMQAAWIDASEWPARMYCNECVKKMGNAEFLLPVVNSPRMGVCAYCGDLDRYEYHGPRQK